MNEQIQVIYQKLTKPLAFSICTVILLLLVLFLPLRNHGVFESPDENANYLTTRFYANTGQIWYQEDYTELDVENYLHPRHFVTYNNRVVPTQFLGLPIVYGPLYSFAGDSATIIWVIILSLMSFTFFIKLAALIFGAKASRHAAIVFLANIPLLWYLAMPYFNSAGAITFFIAGSFYLVRFYRISTGKDLILASLFLALSIFFRYDYAIFIGLLIVITLVNKYRGNWITYRRPILVSLIVITLTTLVPILVLNSEVYGHPLTFGINILEVHSMGREANSIWHFFLPYSVMSDVILTNIYRLILKLLPVITLLAITGLVCLAKHKRLNGYHVLYVLLFLYIVVHSGSSDTWRATDFNYLGLDVSIIRYWLIAYFALTIIAMASISFLKEKYKALTVLILFILLVTSISSFLVDNDRSVSVLAQSLNNNQRTGEIIRENVDKRSIIYSDIFDKILSPLGMRSAGWWGGEKTYDPQKLADSMVRVHFESDYSVYLYAPSSYVDVADLNDILKENHLFLESHTAIEDFYELKEAAIARGN